MRWLTLSLLLMACSTPYARRDPVGEKFPTTTGNTLSGKEVSLPEDFAGKKVLLIVGYEQDSQFDIDRWLVGLTMAKAEIDIYEVPTIPGLVPGMFAGRIDEGMRSGIPSEAWASVITVYDDGDAIAAFTGNENPLPGRVLLLSPSGEVVWFHDRGFSPTHLTQLLEKL